MSLRNFAVQKVGQTRNVFTYGLLNFVLRERFFRAFYGCLQDRVLDWQGKRACFSLSFDCDFSEDMESIPRLLEILSRYSVKASFACIGKWVERYPSIHKRVIEEGHEIINHTYTHPPSEELDSSGKFNELSLEEQREEIAKCHKVCKDVLGYEPIGFRIPHCGGQYTDSIYGVLKGLGYSYSSSLKAIRSPDFGLPFYTNESILELPLTTCPRHPINTFDTWHAFHVGKHSEKEFYELFRQIIDTGIGCGAYMNLYFDPRDVVTRDSFVRILELLEEKRNDLCIMKYEELARWKWQ